MERFELLNEESKKMKMPKHYKEDVEADRKMLVEHKGNFLWILRPAGTVFLPLEEKTKEELEIIKKYLDYYSNFEENLFYFFNGKELKKVSYKKAVEIFISYNEKAKTGDELSISLLESFPYNSKDIFKVINYYKGNIPSKVYKKIKSLSQEEFGEIDQFLA